MPTTVDPDAPLSLRDRLKAALVPAMKSRDRAATAAIRSALGAIDNAEAVDAPELPPPGDTPIAGSLGGLGAGEAARRELTEADVETIVAAEIADLRSQVDEYTLLGRDDRAAELLAGAVALEAVVGATPAGEPHR